MSNPAQNNHFAHWNEVVCRTFAEMDVESSERGSFTASLSTADFGLLQSSSVTSTKVRYTRDPDHIRRASDDSFLASVKLQGTGVACQDGREAVLGPGDIVVYDTARPFTLDYPNSYCDVTLKIPRKLLSSRLIASEKITARTLSGATSLGRLAGGLLQECGSLGEECDPSVRARLSTSLLDVLTLAIEAELLGKNCRETRHDAMIDRIKTWISERLSEASLDTDAIADANAVSPRTLQRLFAAQGDTAMRWLWNQRLQASYRALAERRVDQVTQAAIECGFTDFSHFSRAFKRTFGVLPHQVLEQKH
ncbi:helix-turn-helix domain-containing protein [Variovorax sp. J31P207]|uniref:AraC-like ligand-binding domain-containing protein n=1 Tax=Variovorax sp. J31P207 TaxID=3053510 RepID=UPI0025755DE5|nr:helix-turn-helix domain-containing protein [Variovorax sp. J31P207]MDM0071528.1 helix-turn-helix domain-containing protein [Variovorax sp. J31P207]